MIAPRSGPQPKRVRHFLDLHSPYMDDSHCQPRKRLGQASEALSVALFLSLSHGITALTGHAEQ